MSQNENTTDVDDWQDFSLREDDKHVADCAQTFLIVTVDDGRFSERQLVVASDWATHQRPGRLIALGVDTIVCGSIDRWSAESLQSAGVEIYDRVAGETKDALNALLRGELHSIYSPRFLR